jgi:hypothetical protein
MIYEAKITDGRLIAADSANKRIQVIQLPPLKRV